MGWFGNSTPAPREKNDGKRLAPAPVAPASLLGTTVPPDTTLARSSATADAMAAAARARKKAGGSLLTGKPVERVGAAAVIKPKSLIGGGGY